ncbi:PREDICTED: E3 ubiquitin-protein ligase KCMF1 [Bactrocera latifrons]|nr:PREDICTED: E3 ubiquitin-protein ligase KCMF1 [Bactrocera latifrons]
MSRHEGVSCDSCLKSNFNGRRYKCLICYDYDLCADCYEDGVTSTRHLVDHPMQCILTRSDIELFFGGEMLNSEQPQSFTCPYCKKMGFSDATLLEHVSAEHTETSLEVVCPVCAGLPGGEPNLVTDDFAGHLTLEHRTGPRELISFLDEPSAIRHGGGVRRIPGRTLGGPRARRSNMHFSSSSGLSALSPSGRESVDPIAELLSQLSGVRRGGPQTSQLQQLQMQIQLERQQVTATRQQLERLPRRAHPMVSSSNSNATMPEVISSGPILSGSGSGGSGGSGASGSGSLNGGGGSSCRTNEWTVNSSLAAQQQPQSGLTGNAGINNRESGGGSGNVNGGSGSNANNILGMSIAGGAVGAGVNSASNGADVQSQFLLTKFMQPTLSDTEWAEMERERSDRSQFVQALVLSTLSYDSLDTIAMGGGETERDNRDESQETNSDNVNNEKVSAANTKSDANARESLMNNNTDASAQTTNTSGSSSVSAATMPGNGRQQVHQQQQTTPEDIADEYKQLQQQQQQAQQQTYPSKKKSTSNSGVSGGAGGTGGKSTADRGIERRGRPPPPPVGGGAAAAGSQPQQQHSR